MVLVEDRSPDDAERVWSKYGLKQTPYQTTPTRLLGTLPIDKVFCARKEEVGRLKNIIRSAPSTATLVVGNFGVGKTTFVNYVRWSLSIKRKESSKYLTTSVEIKVQPDWDATKYLLSTLSAIHTASIVFDWSGMGIKLPSLKKIEEYVAISTQRNFHGGAVGLSAGYGEAKIMPPIFNPEILEHLLSSCCAEAMRNGKEIIVSYDNLEDIKRIDQLADFFKSIRDYTQIEGLHSIFIGPPNIIAAIEKYPQVHSVFSQPILLEALAAEDVLEVLQKRCEALSIENGRYIQPYEELTVRALYTKLNNIRFTFRVLEDATLIMEQKAPCKITMREIIAVQELEKNEIFSKLTNQQTRIISALMEENQLTQKDLASRTDVGQTNIGKQIDELEKKGLVIANQSEEDKRYKYIRISDNSYLKLIFAGHETSHKK
jgi:DNA-binding MarR family transcriptional regulator